MNEDMKQYLEMYVKEAEELLQSMNKSLLDFEKDPCNGEALREIARCAHTVKSSSASMGFQEISNLAHSMEDLFVKLEKSGVDVTDGLIDTLFECFDALESGVAKVGKDQKEPNVSKLLKKLETLTADEKKGEPKKEPVKKPQKTVKEEPTEEIQKTSSSELIEKPQTLRLINSINVDIAVLDNLLNLVGELLISKMKLQIANDKQKIKEFDEIIDELGILIEEIQYEVTEARMIPLDQVFNRFPRMIRDISKKEGKEIDFIVRGGEIRLDRTVLDQLGEPLIHLLRNSVDHGIEDPETRKKNGKAACGKIELSARREKNYVLIDIIDDGQGFEIERIREIALKKGLVKTQDLEGMTQQDMVNLALLPGFTTSSKVTEFSGRGVGLDVVKKKLEELNGQITIDTEPGKGSSFTIKLPPTMAIVKCLMVTVSDRTFAIPITNILRIVKVESRQIKHIENNEVFILDGEDIPLIRLTDKFHIQRDDKEDLKVLIVEQNQEKTGLTVDGILGEQEIMIKSLMNELKTTKGFSGATILGNGRLALVLDVPMIISNKM